MDFLPPQCGGASPRTAQRAPHRRTALRTVAPPQCVHSVVAHVTVTAHRRTAQFRVVFPGVERRRSSHCLDTVVATIARWRSPSRVFHEVAGCRRSCRVRDLSKTMASAAANFPPPRRGGALILSVVSGRSR